MDAELFHSLFEFCKALFPASCVSRFLNGTTILWPKPRTQSPGLLRFEQNEDTASHHGNSDDNQNQLRVGHWMDSLDQASYTPPRQPPIGMSLYFPTSKRVPVSIDRECFYVSAEEAIKAGLAP